MVKREKDYMSNRHNKIMFIFRMTTLCIKNASKAIYKEIAGNNLTRLHNKKVNI